MSFDEFLECMENVPPELRRNFTLILDLDKRTKDIMRRIDNCLERYEKTSKRSERLAIKQESNDLFEKLRGFSDDKIELAIQTYDMIDKNIRRLINLGMTTNVPSESAEAGTTQLIGYDMPLDPNEPKYCICRGVSHGEMVACDNKECVIEWFHYACVGLDSGPKGKWFCPDCNVVEAAKNKKSRRSRRKSSY